MKIIEKLKDLFQKHKHSLTEISFIAGIFLVWRITLQFYAFIVRHRFSLLEDPGYGIGKNPMDISPWIRWDSVYYLFIANNGYNYDQNARSVTAFFPLYPMIINFFSNLFNIESSTAAVIISSFFCLLTCVYIYKLAKLNTFDDTIAKRVVLYLLIFPTAIFLITVYNESLFIFLAVASFYYAQKQKWFLSGIFGFFASLTRIQGVILFVALLIEYLDQRKFDFRKIKPDILSLLFIPAGIGSFMIYLHIKFGNALLFLSEQQKWGRSTMPKIQNYIEMFYGHFKTLFSPLVSDNTNFGKNFDSDVQIIVFLIFIILSIIIFFKLRKSYGIYMLLGLLIPAYTCNLTSIQRYVLLLFPFFIFLGILGKNKFFNYSVIIISTLFFSFYTILFINWYWAG